jgi:hypothetical protein
MYGKKHLRNLSVNFRVRLKHSLKNCIHWIDTVYTRDVRLMMVYNLLVSHMQLVYVPFMCYPPVHPYVSQVHQHETQILPSLLNNAQSKQISTKKLPPWLCESHIFFKKFLSFCFFPKYRCHLHGIFHLTYSETCQFMPSHPALRLCGRSLKLMAYIIHCNGGLPLCMDHACCSRFKACERVNSLLQHRYNN